MNETGKTSPKLLLKFMEKFSLSQLVREYTRLAEKDSILDLIITNCRCVSLSGVLQVNISDHMPVYMVRKKTKDSYQKIEFEGRSYYNFDENVFINLLMDEDWDFVYGICPFDDVWDSFFKKVEKILDNYCPLKKFKFRHDKPEWMTNELVEFIKDRDAALNRATKTKKQEDKKIARNIRNFTNNMVRNAKASFIKEQLEHNKNNPKFFWHSIRDVIPDNTNSADTILELKDENGETVPGHRLADHINSYFATVGTKLAEQFDNSQPQIVFQNYEFDPLILQPITLDQLKKEIDRIAIYKSSGFKNISSKIWKIVFKTLDVYILHIVNTAILTNQFPSAWKQATIVPIPKMANPNEAGDLRPIALLPIIGKMVERFVHTQIMQYLNSNDLLSLYQNGFRQEHSTMDTIYKLISDIDQNNNRALDTIAVYVDFKKAFDTVNHQVLITKASALNLDLSVLNWLTNYLNNRKQLTLIKKLKIRQTISPMWRSPREHNGPFALLDLYK